VLPGTKKPAIEWQEYFDRRLAPTELDHYWNNGHDTLFNIGIIHGYNGSVSIDIDHDNGIWDILKAEFPELFKGRIELSGSGNGYHIPLFLDSLPDFGHDSNKDRPRGNKTWKVEDKGSVNIRARWSQTVVPPSFHPSGKQYLFIQKKPITRLSNLDCLIDWLDKIAPPKRRKPYRPKNVPSKPGIYNNLLEVARSLSCFDIFTKNFQLGNNQFTEYPNGEIKIHGDLGGLFVFPDNGWYHHESEQGGGPIEAWAWARFGTIDAKKENFRQILLEMAAYAGVPIAQFYKPGDEKLVNIDYRNSERVWEEQYAGYWS